MDVDTLLENFETLAEAPSGIDLLKDLCLDLALRGKFNTCDLPSEDLSKTHSCSGIDLGIPNHWGTVSFSENFDIKGGGQPPKSTFVDSPQPGYIRLYQIRDYGPNPVPVYIPSRIAPKTTKKGDILLARYGASGKVFWAEEGAYNVALAKLIFPESLYLKPFAFLLFKSNWFQDTIRSTTRVAVDGFNKNDLKNIHFPLPPLDEQQLIVAKVDELMALCDQLEQQQKNRDNLRTATRKSAIDAISTATTPEELEAAWQRINSNWEVIADTPESIESLRELILDLAVRGDLGITDISDVKAPTLWDVEEQRLDVDKLWKLDTMHVNPANGWSRLPLARLGTWGSGGTPTASRKEFYNNGSIPWAVTGDLNNGIMTDTSSKITQKALTSSSAKLIPKNAVLIAMYGASIGKTAITGIECTTNQAIAHCIVDESVVSTEYFFLVAKSLKKHLIKVGKGAAQPNISQTVLKHLLIDVPQLNAQQIVVSKVNELMALCDQLESMLKSRSELAEKFAQSVVNAA